MSNDAILLLYGLAIGYILFALFGPALFDAIERFFRKPVGGAPAIKATIGLDATAFRKGVKRAGRACRRLERRLRWNAFKKRLWQRLLSIFHPASWGSQPASRS